MTREHASTDRRVQQGPISHVATFASRLQPQKEASSYSAVNEDDKLEETLSLLLSPCHKPRPQSPGRALSDSNGPVPLVSAPAAEPAGRFQRSLVNRKCNRIFGTFTNTPRTDRKGFAYGDQRESGDNIQLLIS
ncbi:hypothetical protein EYF80_023582 [Liparis tanakae]|uniref:Uncharacterized protein n=1 Tax=Liparis tanakae TaxID=230148 RepID=A0A4Z2HMN8_9TELE|nr:hypothetical protein EYF80_023582 [Liparis tanakae]